MGNTGESTTNKYAYTITHTWKRKRKDSDSLCVTLSALHFSTHFLAVSYLRLCFSPPSRNSHSPALNSVHFKVVFVFLFTQFLFIFLLLDNFIIPMTVTNRRFDCPRFCDVALIRSRVLLLNYNSCARLHVNL